MRATTEPLNAAVVVLTVLTIGSAVMCGNAGVMKARVATGPAADSSPGPRVRSSHPYLRAIIDEAILRSSTLRGIVAAIEQTNGIVYVEYGACMRSVRACLPLEITAAARYRILRVTVDARQPDWEVMASIGHELRHALEILENPALVDHASLYLFYAQGREANNRPFETRAAIDAGDAVHQEVSSFARRRQP